MFSLLHNSTGDFEHTFSSAVANFEVFTGIEKTFVTTLPNQLVHIDVQIPFTVIRPVAGATNGTLRLYLDGTAQDAADGKAWNGYLVGHGSGWQLAQNIPATAMPVSVHQWFVIPTVGEHKLRLQAGTNTTDTSVTIRSRQFWQVWTNGDQVSAPPPPPPPPSGAILLDVTEPANSAPISSNTANVEVTAENKTFTTGGEAVTITANIPVQYMKVGGANAIGNYRLYLNNTLLAAQASPTITTNGTLPNGPWTNGATLTYTGQHTLPAGNHTLSLRYVGNTTLVCGRALANRNYKVQVV
jgi:hypothetical protein